MRKKITLVCSQCLSRNYTTTKPAYGVSERFEIVKFCKKCNNHTLHKESK